MRLCRSLMALSDQLNVQITPQFKDSEGEEAVALQWPAVRKLRAFRIE